MDAANSRERPPSGRRAIYGAAFGAVGGAIGGVIARPLVGAFHDFPPWVLPAVVAIVLALLVLALMLLPAWFRHRSKP